MTSPGSARGFRQPRCSGCGLTAGLCVCRLWAPLACRTQVSVVMPRSEARSASNTARLLSLWLPNVELHVHGSELAPRQPEGLVQRPGSALLFPSGGPPPALPASVRHLLVPDGTWSQARRIERRWFAPHALPRVQLSAQWPSVYQLRRGRPGLCTFEATAIALGVLEDVPLGQMLLERFAEWARRAHLLKAGGPPIEGPPASVDTAPPRVTHPAASALETLPRGAP